MRNEMGMDFFTLNCYVGIYNCTLHCSGMGMNWGKENSHQIFRSRRKRDIKKLLGEKKKCGYGKYMFPILPQTYIYRVRPKMITLFKCAHHLFLFNVQLQITFPHLNVPQLNGHFSQLQIWYFCSNFQCNVAVLTESTEFQTWYIVHIYIWRWHIFVKIAKSCNVQQWILKNIWFLGTPCICTVYIALCILREDFFQHTAKSYSLLWVHPYWGTLQWFCKKDEKENRKNLFIWGENNVKAML